MFIFTRELLGSKNRAAIFLCLFILPLSINANSGQQWIFCTMFSNFWKGINRTCRSAMSSVTIWSVCSVYGFLGLLVSLFWLTNFAKYTDKCLEVLHYVSGSGIFSRQIIGLFRCYSFCLCGLISFLNFRLKLSIYSRFRGMLSLFFEQ